MAEPMAEFSGQLSPTEVTTRYATTVAELSDAWAFIMGNVEKVGPDPLISIRPMWRVSSEDPDDFKPPRVFEVVVSGMVEDRELS